MAVTTLQPDGPLQQRVRVVRRDRQARVTLVADPRIPAGDGTDAVRPVMGASGATENWRNSRPRLNRGDVGCEPPAERRATARPGQGGAIVNPIRRVRVAGTTPAGTLDPLYVVVPPGFTAPESTLQCPVAGHASHAVGLRPAAGRFMAWAADRESAGARRGLQIALGVAWVLDAALQYQPYMFGKGFVAQVLAPAAMGNPALIARPALTAGWLIGQDVAIWNALFATIQLALGAGLLWRRTARAALAGTIAWSVLVWWLGEGLGGLLTGTATPLTGAPGAAVLYAVLAVLIWPAPAVRQQGGSVADGSPFGRRWARLVWLTLWGSSAYLVLQASGRSPRALPDLLSGLAGAAPGWIASADRAAAAATGAHGVLVSAAIAAVFVLIGAGVLTHRTARPVLALTVIAALVIWVAGENFGGIFTGQGTDPSTGPLLILLAAAFWPPGRPRTGPARLTVLLGGRVARVLDDEPGRLPRRTAGTTTG